VRCIDNASLRRRWPKVIERFLPTDKKLRRYGSVSANSVRHKIRQDQFDPVDRTGAQDSITLIDDIENRSNDESHKEGPAGNAIGYGVSAHGFP